MRESTGKYTEVWQIPDHEDSIISTHYAHSAKPPIMPETMPV